MLYEPLVDRSEERQLAQGNTQPEATVSPSGLDPVQHFSDEARQDRMQTAMLNVMEGASARGRSLKYWENLRLKPAHMQMLLMKAAGFSNRHIADSFDYTEARVSVIVNHPDAMYLLSCLVSFQAEGLLDVNARIQAHSGEALDTALMLMRTGKEETREKIAFKLLDRAGYGAIKKVEVNNKFEMPATQATALTAALRESNEVEDMSDADFEFIESGPAGESGSSGEEERELDLVAHDEPPIVAQQVPASLTVAERLRRIA